jgi:uncharacterized membrane protein YccC
VRVTLAFFASMLLTTGNGIPHGLWASVTVMVVMGGLQHQGTIRGKSYERMLGTALGAIMGLAVIGLHSLTGSTTLIYLLMSVLSGISAYYAIGKSGYVALLTGITLSIVAGHGGNDINEGLWRTLNVFIGIVLALSFAQVYPLRAVYVWRYLLADNLRACARLYARVSGAGPASAERMARELDQIGRRLISARAHFAPVSRETGISMKQLEEIQHLQRGVVGTLESLVASSSLSLKEGNDAEFRAGLDVQRTQICVLLLQAGQALRFSHTGKLRQRYGKIDRDVPRPRSLQISFEQQGNYWLTLRLHQQVDQLVACLIETARYWNIQARD